MFGNSDVVGDMLMIGACAVNTMMLEDMRQWLGGDDVIITEQ